MLGDRWAVGRSSELMVVARRSGECLVEPGAAAEGAIVYDMVRLPPTSADVDRGDARPYFLWWTDATVDDLRKNLLGEDRAYWLGALLREANTRDVWCFVSAAEIRAAWPDVVRHLGKSRAMWAYLLELPDRWPPQETPLA